MLSELPYWFCAGVAIALGLTLGSFLNVVIYRLPRGENVAYPASRCPGCGAPIRAYDNVPVFSWLLLRGRARCCKTRISPRYPLIELLGGLAAWAVLEKVLEESSVGAPLWTPIALFFAYLTLGLGLVALIFIDLEFMILPDEITLGGAALGLATASLRHLPWSSSLIGAAVGFVIVWLPFDVLYRLVRGHPGMGLGDAKLLMLAGAWFGWKGALFALLAGAVQGTLVTIVVLVVKGRIEEPSAITLEREAALRQLESLEGDARRELEEELAKDPLYAAPRGGVGNARVPFGPFLAIAVIEYLFFGEALVEAYLGFLWNG
jgi:leader peptidase (prepilin peptidase)/N-methyltransferase